MAAPGDPPGPAAMQLAANLRALRKDAGMTQAQLAHAADLHPNAVGFLERGERDPRLSTLLALARALDDARPDGQVGVADLVDGVGTRPP